MDEPIGIHSRSITWHTTYIRKVHKPIYVAKSILGPNYPDIGISNWRNWKLEGQLIPDNYRVQVIADNIYLYLAAQHDDKDFYGFILAKEYFESTTIVGKIKKKSNENNLLKPV